MNEMSPRERVLTAMNRQKPDRVPKTAGFTPAIMDLFKEKTGSNNPAEYFEMEPRGIGPRGSKERPDFSKYFKDLPENATIDEWGTARVVGSMHHFTRRIYPMASLTSVEEIEEYPWPDLDAPYRTEHYEESAKKLHDSGYYVQGSVGHIFEIAWQMRGMDNLFLDFTLNPLFAERLLDKITSLKVHLAQRAAEANADMLHLGDDVGMQDRLMMSPDTWRKWFKPRLRKVIEAATKIKPDMQVFYHSDGYINPIIPDLIEVGITVLNPVQPECCDPVELKKKYGDQLAFWGTIGTQTTMPFGTPDEVKQTVKERIETIGYDGGLLLAPTHVLEPDVPWENIVAFFEAVEEYGLYQ